MYPVVFQENEFKLRAGSPLMRLLRIFRVIHFSVCPQIEIEQAGKLYVRVVKKCMRSIYYVFFIKYRAIAPGPRCHFLVICDTHSL